VVLVCPRCGSRGWVEEKEINNRVYIYVAHEERDPDGKKRRRYCYLGPKGGYKYVSRLHEREGLVLRNILDEDRALDYLERLVEHIEGKAEDGEIDVERLERIVSRLAEVVRRSRGLAATRRRSASW